ncbi:MAG: phospholipase [Gammaproteobacteria bacterium]|nr:phospholipase [Gammaproteobacteria bacterium]
MASTESAGLALPTARDSRDGTLLDRAFTRAAGAPLIAGNGVRLLKDAAENYPAWLEAIRHAQHSIYFENYFIVEDRTGEEFAEALALRARAGVRVRLIYDWVGAFGKASGQFWRRLSDAGVEVRCFNRLRFASPLDVLHRDHRKMLAVDSRIGFVTGLCVGDMWTGDAAKGTEPWRDTGVEIRGPGLCDVERAFAKVWAAIGTPIPVEELASREAIESAGDVSLRIVANAPGTTGIFRLDQLIAAAARRTLWLTDAYFAGVPPYVQALRAAALDGVDVRLLVPGASDIPILRPLSQAGFRPLLEAGIRVFQWKGSMLHAKTAVADGRWARVGSSNLNIASWIGNYELDAVIENEAFAAAMERRYFEDLEYSTEIVLCARRRGRFARIGEHRQPHDRSDGRLHREVPGMSGQSGSASRAAAGALRLGRTVGAALTEQRVLAATEARLVAIVGILLLTIAVVAVLWPHVVAIPIAVICLWMAVALLMKAHSLRNSRRARGLPTTRVGRAEPAAMQAERLRTRK